MSTPDLTGQPSGARPPRVAVIGAGIAGLACARTLADHAVLVEVFDKARAPGGRTSTRRRDGFAFDHGAQYFTARDHRFARAVASWVADGAVAPWHGRFAEIAGGASTEVEPSEPRFVGTPGMSALGRHLAAGLSIRTGARIVAVTPATIGWCLRREEGEIIEGFDAVLVTAPAPQAVPLLAAAPALAAAAAAADMAPCWAAMLAFDRPLPLAFDGAEIGDGPLAWIARNGAKPGRRGDETWVLHASPQWSRANLDDEPEDVLGRLLQAFAGIAAIALPRPVQAMAHCWRYARAECPIGQPCLFDRDLGIGAAGDWCLGGRIEAAYLSGIALAGQVLGRVHATAAE